MTLRKLKTMLPSLKQSIEKPFKSGLVYLIKCAECNAAYVGQTARHLKTRVNEHQAPSKPVKKHFQECGSSFNVESTEILAATSRGSRFLETLEALFIEELQPSINTKDEYRSRTLTIKFF